MFNWNHSALCGEIPFRPSAYPTHASVGNWDEFPADVAFSTTFNASFIPFSVDVEKLTDVEISSLCLTTRQCRFPPMLSMVRDAGTGQPWRPGFGDFDASYGKNVPESPVGPIPYNYRTRTYARILSNNSYYPRGATAANATIVRVDFAVLRKKLYMYVDLTCGLAEGYERRNGFTGNWGGQFKEVLYKIPGLNIHNPLRTDTVGYSTDPTDYEDPIRERSLQQTFVFVGSGNAKKYNWLSLHQSWLTVSPVYPPEAVVAYLDAGLKWASLLLPVGNLPVASMYVHAAHLNLKRTRGAVSWAAIRAYGGYTFNQYAPAIEYLLSTNGLDSATACRNSLPKSFLSKNPPEAGCWGVIDCITWRHPACNAFGDLMRRALDTVRKEITQSVPRCVDCPGLIGVSRGNVPPENPFYPEIKKFPQCLPHQTSNGTIISSPDMIYI
jgi:hypothetical protein